MTTATELQPTDLVEIHNLTKSHYLLPGGRTIRPGGSLKGLFLSQVSIEAQMDTQGENPRLAIVAVGAGLPDSTKPHDAPAEIDIEVVLPSEDSDDEVTEESEDVETKSPLDKAAIAKKTSRRRTKDEDAEDEDKSSAKTEEENVALESPVGGIAGETVYDRDDSPGSQVMAAWLKRGSNDDESGGDEDETEATPKATSKKKKTTAKKKAPPRRGRRGSALRSK